jgi:peptidoglycan hydrolase-like protein with peptidoglycan-binding domain
MALRTEAVRNSGVIAPPSLTEDSVDEATQEFLTEAAAPLIARSEILLSRVHFSLGEIDGQDRDNYRRALRAFQQANKLPDTSKLDAVTWSALTHDQTEPVLKRYTITPEDVAGPFEKRLSANLVDMARLSGLSYSSPPAELAEMFHMGEDMVHRLIAPPNA